MINPIPANGPYYALSALDIRHLLSTTAHLLYQQLPVDAHRSLLVLPAILPQAPRQFTHPFQAVPTVQQVFNVLGHDFRDILQLVV